MEAHEITAELIEACERLGLLASAISPTRVHVCAPKTHSGLAEVITLAPDQRAVLHFHWSWGDPVCPAAEIDRAAKSIAYVVSPASA